MGCSSPTSNKRKDAGLLVFHRHVALWAKGDATPLSYPSGIPPAKGTHPATAPG